MQYLRLACLFIHGLSGVLGQQVHEPRFTVFDTQMTWIEAVDTCKQRNSVIVDAYPEVPQKFKTLLKKYGPYWIGKSLTPWVIFRGCIEWKGQANKKAVYDRSKYNQMSECAAACMGSVSFLLQRKSCFCLNKEENKTVTNVPYKQCSVPCPGRSRDKCGGRNVYTYYEYYHGDIKRDNETYNCVCKQDNSYKPCDCDIRKPFTCDMTNGSKVTFKEDVPGRSISLSYIEAVDYCRSLTGGLRISPVPEFITPYFGHEYWTTVTRAIDWNYDTVSDRRPVFGCVAKLDEAGRYREEYEEVSEKYRFVCQNVEVTHEMYTKSDTGNITSPDYPGQYKNNQLYKWNIESNISTEIQLVFEDINLENSTGCIYDYILVIGNNRSIVKLCGKSREKQIITRDQPVTIVFRTDRSIAGTGFRLSWSAGNDGIILNSGNEQKSPNGKSISGGAVAGITVVAAIVFVVVASLIACLVYRKTHEKRPGISQEETSNVHNLAYAMSSFNSGSGLSSDNQYRTVLQTNDKLLKPEASCASGPNKTQFAKVTDDDNYLNAGLASNIKGPYYDHVDLSPRDQHGVGKPNKSNSKMVNSAENEYIEISNI